MTDAAVINLLGWGLMVLAVVALSGLGSLLLVMKWVLTGKGILERRPEAEAAAGWTLTGAERQAGKL